MKNTLRKAAVLLLVCFGALAVWPQQTAAAEKTFLTKPKSHTLITTDSGIVFAGIGKENDEVTLEIYAKNGAEYRELTKSLFFKLEALGIFMKEISLNPGDNKIIATLWRPSTKELFTEVRYVRFDNLIDLTKMLRSLDIKSVPAPAKI